MTVDNKTTADPVINAGCVQTGNAKLAALQRLHDAMVEGRKPDNDTIIAAFGCRRLENGWDATALIGWIMAPADIRAMGAAKALHEALVPGWAIDRMAWWPGGHWAFHLLGTGEPDHNGDRWHGHADGHVEASDADPARAWTLAIIKALMAQEGE